MKKLTTILLCLLTLTSYTQERMYEAEKLIFNMVNSYRVSQGLEEVTWSDKVYESAYHHSSYMSNKGVEFEHTEVVDVEGHEEINDAQQRIRKYCGEYSWGTECMAGLPLISGFQMNLLICGLRAGGWFLVGLILRVTEKQCYMIWRAMVILQFGAVSVIHLNYCTKVLSLF